VTLTNHNVTSVKKQKNHIKENEEKPHVTLWLANVTNHSVTQVLPVSDIILLIILNHYPTTFFNTRDFLFLFLSWHNQGWRSMQTGP